MNAKELHNTRLFLSGIFLGACLVLLNGCVIPFPHFKETCGPICGYIMAEDPDIPIKNALVEASYPDNGHLEVHTDESGYFYFSKKHRFHWGILFGVALNHSLPFDEYIDGYAKLNIKAEGYDERIILMGSQWYSRLIDDPNDFYLRPDETKCPVVRLSREN